MISKIMRDSGVHPLYLNIRVYIGFHICISLQLYIMYAKSFPTQRDQMFLFQCDIHILNYIVIYSVQPTYPPKSWRRSIMHACAGWSGPYYWTAKACASTQRTHPRHHMWGMSRSSDLREDRTGTASSSRANAEALCMHVLGGVVHTTGRQKAVPVHREPFRIIIHGACHAVVTPRKVALVPLHHLTLMQKRHACMYRVKWSILLDGKRLPQ